MRADVPAERGTAVSCRCRSQPYRRGGAIPMAWMDNAMIEQGHPLSTSPTPPPPPPPSAPPDQPPWPTQRSSGLAVTALVCGLLGMVIALIPILGIFGIALGLVAVVLGLIGRSKAKKGEAAGKGMALAGAITGVLAVTLGIVGLVIVGNAFNELESVFDEEAPAFSTGSDVAAPSAPPATAGAMEPSDTDSSDTSTQSTAGSRDNPVPLGTIASFEDWDVSIDEVKLNATEEVMSANDFNSEPENGQYALITFTFTYTGEGEGNAMFAFKAVLVGSDARQYETYECMAVTPNSMSDAPTLEQGGTFTGSECFDVPPDVLDDGAHLFIEPTISFSDDARAYYELPNG